MSHYSSQPKQNYETMKECHRIAYRSISKALEQDEAKEGDKAKALELYRLGMSALQEGIQMEAKGRGVEEEIKITELREKMIKNMELCQGRTESLMRSNSTDRPSSDIDGTSKPKTHTNRNSNKNAADRERPSQFNSNLRRQPLKSSRKTWSPDEKVVKRRDTSHLKGVDPELVKTIADEIIDGGQCVRWEDVVGLDLPKRTLEEIVILPAQRPELFTGLRSPAKGLLLFGPPGNGKTMIAKAVAGATDSTFFCISASSLTSKWLGESEKLVKALFAVARDRQPSIIFIDEVDAILSKRGEKEHEATRRLKNEFLLSFDGMQSSDDDRILVMAATNRPEEIDEAALRRFVKRIYVPLPQPEARKAILSNLLRKHHNSLSEGELNDLAMRTENYSASDLTALARDAAFGPIREMNAVEISGVPEDQVRPINHQDFVQSMKIIRPSVTPATLEQLAAWSKQYGATT